MVAPSFAPLSLLIPGGPGAARRARHAVLGRLAGQLSDVAANDLGVVISELVSNSVVHAGVGPGRYLRVNVGAVEDHLLVAVSDRGSITVPRLSATGDDDAEGLGLR